MNTDIQLLGPFTQLLPMSQMPLRGALKDSSIPIIHDGGLLVQGDQILEVGPYAELLNSEAGKQAKKITAEGEFAVLPGMIDGHTHSCFAGSRARDYAMRNGGQSYLEIAAAGGGIWDTVTQTRKASLDELRETLVSRCRNFATMGITTLEVKSGYGLNPEEELKMLQAINGAAKEVPQDLVATCLAAHMAPRDFSGSKTAYLDWIASELLPVVRDKNLATRVDAFVEETAFSPEEIRPYLEKATQMGFDLTVHADQFSTGGSAVAIACGAKSADHLEASGAREIELFAKSDTIPVALPGASLGLGCAFTPARRLLDAGASLAIASDYNPGSAPMGDLLTQAAILGTFEKLSNTEVLAGITFRAAAALGLKDRGVLASGKRADFIAFPTADYREILYRQGQLRPSKVWIAGEQIL